MAQLYFKYGAMGSSKTANALMARFNYEERGQKTLLVKPRLDQRDGDHMVHSRIGLEYPCIYFDEMLALPAEALQENACIIVDEAQFLSKEEVDYLVHIVDDLGVPVICYGLRADFKGELFPGSYELLVMADKLEEVKTICWCGKKAMFNARFDENGRVLKEGAQVVLGANDKYIGLCRRHWRAALPLGPFLSIGFAALYCFGGKTCALKAGVTPNPEDILPYLIIFGNGITEKYGWTEMNKNSTRVEYVMKDNENYQKFYCISSASTQSAEAELPAVFADEEPVDVVSVTEAPDALPAKDEAVLTTEEPSIA